jgi:hypothetical protein
MPPKPRKRQLYANSKVTVIYITEKTRKHLGTRTFVVAYRKCEGIASEEGRKQASKQVNLGPQNIERQEEGSKTATRE